MRGCFDSRAGRCDFLAVRAFSDARLLGFLLGLRVWDEGFASNTPEEDLFCGYLVQKRLPFPLCCVCVQGESSGFAEVVVILSR